MRALRRLIRRRRAAVGRISGARLLASSAGRAPVGLANCPKCGAAWCYCDSEVHRG